MQDSGKWLRREARRRNRELEGPGRDVGKGELPIIAGQNLLVCGLIVRRLIVRGLTLSGKSHSGSGHDSPGPINHGSTDAPWQSLIGRLLRWGESGKGQRQENQRQAGYASNSKD